MVRTLAQIGLRRQHCALAASIAPTLQGRCSKGKSCKCNTERLFRRSLDCEGISRIIESVYVLWQVALMASELVRHCAGFARIA